MSSFFISNSHNFLIIIQGQYFLNGKKEKKEKKEKRKKKERKRKRKKEKKKTIE